MRSEMVAAVLCLSAGAALACGSSSEQPKEDCGAIAKAIQDQAKADGLTRTNLCADPVQPGYEKACASLSKCINDAYTAPLQ